MIMKMIYMFGIVLSMKMILNKLALIVVNCALRAHHPLIIFKISSWVSLIILQIKFLFAYAQAYYPNKGALLHQKPDAS